MITILNRPYDGILPKVNPVYNGLGFVVDSNYKLNTNFKYIAEIFVSGTKIGELKHNPNISNNFYGLFDPGRIIENNLSSDPNPYVLQTAGSTPALKSLVPYYLRFGEEFSRVNNFTALQNSGGFVRITTSYPHNLVSGDRVLVQATSQNTYNTWSKITYVSATQFVLVDIPYTASADISAAYYISGEEITLWTSYVGSNGSNYLAIRVKTNTSFNLGDKIIIRQDRKDTSGNPVAVVNSGYENAEFLITQKLPGAGFTTLRTNIPYGNAISSTIRGSVISRDNFVYLNSFSTQNDLAYTYNGSVEWNDFLTYSVAPYIFGSTSSYGKFLNGNPNREVDITTDDWYTLQYFGSNQINSYIPNTTLNRRIRIETLSTPLNLGTFTASSIASDSSVSATRTAFIISGNITSLFTVGSEVVFTTPTSYNTTILKSTYSAPNTTLVVDINYATALSGGGPYILQNIVQVRRYDLSFTQNEGIVPAGPKNFNNLSGEIANGTCYRYKIIPIRYEGGNPLVHTTWGETWTFNIKSRCKPGKWIYWLNREGAYDLFYFDGRFDTTRNIEKQNFRRTLKSYQSGVGYKFKNGDRGLSTYNTRSEELGTLRSRYLSQSEIDWLWSIVESPEVYILDGNYKIPITVNDGEYSVPDKRFVGEQGNLYYLTLEYVLSNERVIQRGAI